MFLNQLLDFSWWGLELQFASAVVITGFVAAALVSLSLGRGVIRARLLVAEGVIGGLGVMTAATLLRTIGLRTWHQILMFTLILFLRILLNYSCGRSSVSFKIQPKADIPTSSSSGCS